MNTLDSACNPRDSVFDPQKRDTVLDLMDLIDDKTPADEFIAENYINEGMKLLLKHGFQRLEGKTEPGVFKLKQAMGGGQSCKPLSLALIVQVFSLQKRKKNLLCSFRHWKHTYLVRMYRNYKIIERRMQRLNFDQTCQVRS